MSIAELFESGEKKSNKGHFRNLIMIARADGVVDEKEKELLLKMGKKIGLSPSQITEITDNPEKYPLYPPTNKEDRYERLIGLVEMLAADKAIEEDEVVLIRRFGIGLGFSDEELPSLIRVILQHLVDGTSKYDILEELIG